MKRTIEALNKIVELYSIARTKHTAAGVFRIAEQMREIANSEMLQLQKQAPSATINALGIFRDNVSDPRLVDDPRPLYKVDLKADGSTGATIAMWSTRACGPLMPPKIGQRVDVKMNALGLGTVVGHFVHFGYLGVKVELDAPPKWYTDQNGGNPPARVFGAEIAHVIQLSGVMVSGSDSKVGQG